MSKKGNIKAWLGAMRLRTLPLSFSNILLGSAIAYGMQLPVDSSSEAIYLLGTYNVNILIFTLITTLLLQILSNLANDYGDALKGADNEGRVGPTRAIQSGEISPKAMLNAIIINSILALAAGMYLLYIAFGNQFNWQFLVFVILGLSAIAAAIKYTIGKGAYGYSGLGDVFVFIFFGLVGVVGTFYLHTHLLNWPFFLPAITMGLFSVAVLNLNNMRDQINDAAVGKNTLVVKLGFKRAKIYHFILFIIAYSAFPFPILFMSLNDGEYFMLLPVLPVLAIHISHLRKVALVTDPKDFDPELKKIALSAFLFSLLFFVAVYITL